MKANFLNCRAVEDMSHTINEISKVTDKYFIKNDYIIKCDEKIVSNFVLKILSQKIITYNGKRKSTIFQMEASQNGVSEKFEVPVSKSLRSTVMVRVLEVLGSNAILYGSERELMIAAQYLSPKDRPTIVVHKSNGFTHDGKRYLTAPGIEISAEGVVPLETEEVDLRPGTYSTKLGFKMLEGEQNYGLASHILNEFINLKPHDQTYPLIAHICLSPFSSQIGRITGKQKYALQLQGPSGAGKTLLATAAACFFGSFGTSLPSWSSTANAIEALGDQAKDAVFVLDDYKPGVTQAKTALRVIQNYADGHGRERMRTDGSLEDSRHIRGLLLSTGEGFISGIESIESRLLSIQVAPEKNTLAGRACFQRLEDYRGFLPGLIAKVLNDEKWSENLKNLVDEFTKGFLDSIPNFANNVRIAANWALNAAGFYFFIDYLYEIGVISAARSSAMGFEYLEIVENHISAYAQRIYRMSPTKILHFVLCLKLATGAVQIIDFEKPGDPAQNTRSGAKCIGKISDGFLYLFPATVFEMLSGHYAARKIPIPFTEGALKMSLFHEGHLERMASGRLTTQIRMRGYKTIAWKIRASFLDLDGPQDDG